MIKKLCIVAVLLMAVKGLAQEGATTSPYSFYGVGIQQFRGTVESKAMAGMQIYSDSIHLNLLNPASLSKIKYTTFTVGGNHQQVTAKTSDAKENASKSTFDYLAIAFPVAENLGVNFGLLPYTAVGYRLNDDTETTLNRFSGRGGINRVFLSAGYEVVEGLSLGLSANYNFGNIQNSSLRTEEDVELGAQERNRSDLSGFGFELGAQYERMITDKLQLSTSVKFVPSASYSSENERQISTVQFSPTGATADLETEEIAVADTDFDFPASFTFGVGVGVQNNWFMGVESTFQQSSNFTNRTFAIENVSFKDAAQVRLGGFYIPKYNSVSSYWQRITYRAGLRFEETGIVVSNEDINEFGISFGVGLPAGRKISNLNLTLEYGQRGTTNANLVQENFLNVGVSLSLNDLWFVKTKFN
ncbi:hypothetical protein [Dokdonia sp. Hel_I_53]|uniref:hypothetical protein n=1 Tax=Dokdonia sp. Hel_I_53 TaxID=1566287 RepID=UPI00119AB5A7|nr:hypothetical protein [Dokdonia sp. Hel_I_53]TVZ53098.1 long-subunit fatty acid transport protein [Dokdonia sp. Hel_I_53]